MKIGKTIVSKCVNLNEGKTCIYLTLKTIESATSSATGIGFPIYIIMACILM